MWSGDLFKLKMCSGDRRNVLRRLSPSLKWPQKSPDIRTTISQNMHQYLRTSPKKKRENVGIFPKSGPPLPPVWEFFPDFTVYFWEVSHVKNSKKMDVGFG